MFFHSIRRPLALTALLVLGFGVPLDASSVTATQPKQAKLTNQAASPEIVEVGVWPTVIYNLDVHSDTYYMTAYVWFLWKGPIDPSESVEFVNNVESWGFTKVKTYKKPELLKDGNYYQCLRIEGRFFQPFSMLRFPLERHTVSMTIEDNTDPADKLQYKFDQRNSGVDESVNMSGWEIGGWKGTNYIHHYKSNMGDTNVGHHSADYGAVKFEVDFTRHLSFFLWKMLLPVLIILLATWAALLLPPEKLEPRVAMVGTALITTIFLQQGYASSLPEVEYLVLMDKIYVVVYLLIVISLLQVVIQGTLEKKHLLNDYRKARLVDRISVIVQVIVFVSSLFIINATTR